jgi:hypothetical protein
VCCQDNSIWVSQQFNPVYRIFIEKEKEARIKYAAAFLGILLFRSVAAD